MLLNFFIDTIELTFLSDKMEYQATALVLYFHKIHRVKMIVEIYEIYNLKKNKLSIQRLYMAYISQVFNIILF